jgi:hypothetical protein
MSGTPERTSDYMSECGKKWIFMTSELAEDKALKCRCGRTIVIRRGFVFGKNVASEADKIFKRPGSNIEAGTKAFSVAEV